MRPLQLDTGVSQLELDLDGSAAAPDLVAPEIIEGDHDSTSTNAALGSPRRSSSSAAVPPPKALLLGLPHRALSIEDGTSGEMGGAAASGRKSPHVSSVDIGEEVTEGSGNKGGKKRNLGVEVQVVVVVEGSTEQSPLLRPLAAIPESHDGVEAEGEAPPPGGGAAAVIEEEEPVAPAEPPAPPARSDSLSGESSDASVPMPPPPAPASILRRGSSYLDEERGKPASPPVVMPRRGIKFADAAGGTLQQVSYSDRLHFSPASHTRTWMDLPYNPNRPPSTHADDDSEEEEDDDEDFDLEAFRRTYGGYKSSLRGSGNTGQGSEFWAKVRKSLRKRRRRLARRRRAKEREQEAYRAWQRQQAAEDAVLRRPRGCCIVS